MLIPSPPHTAPYPFLTRTNFIKEGLPKGGHTRVRILGVYLPFQADRSGQAYPRSRPKGRGTKAPSRLDLGQGELAEVGAGERS